MNSPINARVDWRAAIKALGSRVTSATLPASATCPRCRRGQLRLHQDTCQGGVWYACKACQAAGDMLDLVVRTKDLVPDAAIRWLESHGAIAPGPHTHRQLSLRRTQLLDKLKQLQEVWLLASNGRVVHSREAHVLCSQLNLQLEHQLEWAGDGPGRLLGYLSAEEANTRLKAIHAGDSVRYAGVRDRRVLPPEVRGCLVLPYFDVPGRISSLQLFYNDNRHLRCLSWQPGYRSGGQDWVEGGIAVHPKTLGKAGDGRVLLTDNSRAAIRLWCRGFAAAPDPLPLACWQNGDLLTANWHVLANRQMIFWSPTLEPEILWRAMRLGAGVSCHGPKNIDLEEALTTKDPRAVIEQCFLKARSWPEAVSELAAKIDTEELSDWLSQANLTTDEQVMVVDVCPLALQGKMRQALGQAANFRTLADSDGHIEQRTTGWFFMRHGTRGEEPISNMPFRILEVIRNSAPGQVSDAAIYRVQLTYGQQEHVFDIPQLEMERNAAKAITDRAVAAGFGLPAINPRWQRRLLWLSLRLHQPLISQGIVTVGWSEHDNRFSSPHCVIHSDGRISDAGISSPVKGLPGAALCGDLFRSGEAESLFCDAAAQADVTAYLAILQQILSPIACLPPLQVLFRGAGARESLLRVGKALDATLAAGRTIRSVGEDARSHRWPCLAGFGTPLGGKVVRELLKTPELPLVMQANRPQQWYALLTGQGLVWNHSRPQHVAESRLRCLGPLTVAVISELLQGRYHDLLHKTRGRVTAAAELIARVLDKRGIEHTHLNFAAETLVLPGQAVDDLAYVAVDMFRSGAVKLKRVRRRPKLQPNEIYRLQERRQIFVPVNALLDRLQANSAPRLEPTDLTLRLTEGPHPGGSMNFGPAAGWTLPDENFDRLRRKLHKASAAVTLVRAPQAS